MITDKMIKKAYNNKCMSYNRWRKENRVGIGIENYRKRYRIYLKAKTEWEELCKRKQLIKEE